MIVSPAKLAANRANAQKSTGPRTEEGKRICRENAVKHGLSGAGVAIPAGMRAKLEEIIADWTRDFPPHGAYEAALMRAMGLALVRMEEADARLLDFEAVRRLELANSWEDIRAEEAAALGERLEKKPDRTVLRLRQTAHGCEWLKRRWEWLRDGLETTCDWSDAETDRFFDLLGTPRDGREHERPTRSLQHCIQQAKQGDLATLNELRSLVDAQIGDLQKQADKMRQTTDVLLQKLIAGGVWFESNAEGRSLRKFLHQAERQFERTWAKIKEIRNNFMRAELMALELEPQPQPEHEHEPEPDKAEVPAPHLLAIAAKAPPVVDAPSPSPAPQDSTRALRPYSLADLRNKLGIPALAEGTPLTQVLVENHAVMEQAVAKGLIRLDPLAPYRRGREAALAATNP